MTSGHIISSMDGATTSTRGDEYIRLKVCGVPDQTEMHVRVKKTAPMGRIIRSYSELAGARLSSLAFRFGGSRINQDATPNSLEMGQDEVIDVYWMLGSVEHRNSYQQQFGSLNN